MRLIFIGTRANIVRRTRRHRRHAALLVTERGSRVLVDCGADWLGRFEALRPDAIVLTHAHSDHAEGLRAGASAPVYATVETWKRLRNFPLARREVVPLREPQAVGHIVFEAFAVEHSLLAPAVGYRITGGEGTLFYAPDVAAISDPAAALRGVSLYVGDGATVTRPLLRRRDDALIGHAPIRAQLNWLHAQGVKSALFTHCGSQIVCGDGRSLGAFVRRLGLQRGVEARIAFDGLELDMRRFSPR